MSSRSSVSGVWFPAVRTGTGTDVFTEVLADELQKRGVRTQISWMPLRAEYVPWSVPVPKAPDWADVAHISTWLHPRFFPAGLRVIATLHHAIHDPDFGKYKGPIQSTYHRYWIRRVEQETMRRSDHVAAVSRFAARIGRSTLLNRTIHVVPNGVDTECFRPAIARPTGERFRLLYVGSWIRRKGVDLLGPIMRELGDGFELWYTGPTAGQESIDVPRNMRDIGRLRGQSAVAAAMHNADALLFPSRSEGFGLVAAEAMACGLPVIAARNSSLMEVVADGRTGILCSTDDSRAFVDAARRLAGDRTARARMSEQARERACSCYSIRKMVDAYLQLYELRRNQPV